MLDGRPLESIMTSIQQRLEVAMESSTDAHVHRTQEHGGSLTAHLHLQLEELEDVSIRFLSAHSETENWKQIVSLQNKSGQTMAHMAVMLGYLQLLGSLVEWGIDLDLTDFNGSTALHYAFLCNESACAILLIRSGADELFLDELGRSAWELNPSLVDEFVPLLRGIPKIDGTFSVSCHPAEEWEMERPEESAALEANYLLMKRWLQRMEEAQGDINDLNGPQSGIAHPCLPSYPGYGNGKKRLTLRNYPQIEWLSSSTCSDLTIKKTRFLATRANQSTGIVPKIHPLSDDPHPDSQSIKCPPPQYSEWEETNHARPLTSTPSAASNRASTISLTDEEAGQALETWIESSEWCQNDELESIVGAPQAYVQQDSEYSDEPGPAEEKSDMGRADDLDGENMTGMDELNRLKEVKEIEELFNKSAWLCDNLLEPVIGHPTCPQKAAKYGICGASCYTVFVEDNEDGTYGCCYERCHPFQFSSLEGAITHQRYHHFDHRPYECTTLLGSAIW